MHQVVYKWVFDPPDTNSEDILLKLSHQCCAETEDREYEIPSIGWWIEFPTSDGKGACLQVTEITKSKVDGKFHIVLSNRFCKRTHIFFSQALKLAGWTVTANSVIDVPDEFRSHVKIR